MLASIPANIVEGRHKTSERDFSRFIGYAIGSAAELEYHLILARDTGAIERSEALALLSQLDKGSPNALRPPRRAGAW